jgi:hypothetical protein
MPSVTLKTTEFTSETNEVKVEYSAPKGASDSDYLLIIEKGEKDPENNYVCYEYASGEAKGESELNPTLEGGKTYVVVYADENYKIKATSKAFSCGRSSEEEAEFLLKGLGLDYPVDKEKATDWKNLSKLFKLIEDTKGEYSFATRMKLAVGLSNFTSHIPEKKKLPVVMEGDIAETAIRIILDIIKQPDDPENAEDYDDKGVQSLVEKVAEFLGNIQIYGTKWNLHLAPLVTPMLKEISELPNFPTPLLDNRYTAYDEEEDDLHAKLKRAETIQACIRLVSVQLSPLYSNVVSSVNANFGSGRSMCGCNPL